ncbi:MAG: hypothetical protein GYA55_06110 [SAR324 cluster bacterium]|uniref:Uncharacterized protein n=1 Tax=SAR324 cluster bacterium TaxID=2024889 RepID=A0A7X9IJ50_9DELT|nr:hypothetical protein [SAR324 cluster bacterium]
MIRIKREHSAMKSHAMIFVVVLALAIFTHNSVRAAVVVEDSRMPGEIKSQILSLKEATVTTINNYLDSALDSDAEDAYVSEMQSASRSAQALRNQVSVLGLADSPYYLILEQILNAADLTRVATLKFQIAQETQPAESTPVPFN